MSLRRFRYEHVAWGLGGLLGLGLATSRLLGIHGPESALALGLALPPLAGALGARASIQRTSDTSATEVLTRAAMHTLVLWAIPVAVLGLNQMRVRSCTPFEGMAFMMLGPMLGMLLAAVAGVGLGAWVARPRWATALAVLLPIAADLGGLWAFWSTPAIFVYNHFAGWFPGTLYDDDVGLPIAFVTFRLVTVAWTLCVAASIHALWRSERPRVMPLSIAILSLGAALFAHQFGPELHHASSNVAIEEALGRTARGQRCVVHAPRELAPDAVRLLVDDCDFRVARAEQALDVEQRSPVHAYFYRNPEEKRRWMGAGRTYIAKPWRTEVHLQIRSWPHPVLAHEVVHVVAGNAADGPFRVSGTAGGWWPNPGLIEGIAVAVEWPERDGMNPHQYARAMKELELLPPLDDLMGLSFISLPASRAYTGAGSFVRWLLDTRGSSVVAEVHRSGSLGGLDQSVSELEEAWHAYLDTSELPSGALDLARLRFARASIFATTCPHTIARLRATLGADLAAGDDRRVIETCQEILDIEPAELSALSSVPGALARQGDFDDAETAFERLDGAPPPLIARARERIADAQWLRGERDDARATYLQLLSGAQSDGEARAREVKSLAIAAGGPQERLVRDLLVGPHGAGVSAPIAVHLSREIDRFRADGLGRYLEARQVMSQGRYDLMLPIIEDARHCGLPSERIEDEALRMQAVALFATGDLDRSEERWREAAQRPRLRNAAREWLDRIRYHRMRMR